MNFFVGQFFMFRWRCTDCASKALRSSDSSVIPQGVQWMSNDLHKLFLRIAHVIMAATEAVKTIMGAIEASGETRFDSLCGSFLCQIGEAVTDEQLSMLHFLFEKNLERALHILDQGGVQCVISEPGRRTVFQVNGESKSGLNSYLCFPEHFCSCQSFFFDVVSKSEQLCCKHQLAATLAKALHLYKEVIVSDVELAHILLNC